MKSTRLGPLNGLRGIAFLAVLYHHLVSGFTPPGWHALTVGRHTLPVFALLSNGYTGVHLFFVLSGLVLYLPYASGTRAMQTRRDLSAFYRRRFLRLMPLYYFCVAISMGLVSKLSGDARGLEDLGLMATVTFPFTKALWSPRFNWVLWSLGIEIWASVLFPLLIVGARRIGLARLLLMVALVSFCTRVLGSSTALFDYGNVYLDVMSDSVLGRLDEFVLGMLIARLWVDRAWLARQSAPLLAIGGIVLLWIGCALRDLRVLDELPRSIMPYTNIVLDGGFFLVICAALQTRTFARRLVDNAPLQVCGMMCYSLYVWHGILMLAILRGHFNAAHLSIYFLLLATISAFTYRFIEFRAEPDWRRLFRPAS